MGQTIAGIKNDLKEGKTVLFTGTPCQVAAVRRCCKNMGARPSFVPSIDSPATE
jgi:coenzyme F420-reducing hydrogenase beta subunit